MHFSFSKLALIALGLPIIFAHPFKHGLQHIHLRQVDWSNPDLYKNVDWSKINYNQPSTPHPVANAAAPSPAPPKQAAPAVQQKNVVSAPKQQQQNAPQQSKSAPTNNGGGKRGLAYNPGGPSLDLFNSFSDITWAYNWDSNPGSLPSKYQYVPLLFSADPIHTGQWSTNVNKATGPTKYLMSFNEPDMPLAVGGSDMDVRLAVSTFQQRMNPFASKGFKLGSPAVSNGVDINPTTQRVQGLEWLKQFLNQCSNCDISFAPIHWYGCDNGCAVKDDVKSFKDAVTAGMNAAVMPDGRKLPVWVTEFQCKGDAVSFLNEVLPWLDGQSGVERYSYFMVKDGILANGGGISALGTKYGQ